MTAQSIATAGLFVRNPQAQARALDRLAFETGRPKQAVVSELIARYVEDEGPPDPRALALLEPLVANAAALPDLIVDAMWNELSGGEAENGHWWARPGGLETVNEGLDEPITKRGDLWRVLQPDALFVREDVHGDRQLTAGVAFACDFEEEHGLDVLTDGTRVLGTGYALDAEKYARFAKPKR